MRRLILGFVVAAGLTMPGTAMASEAPGLTAKQPRGPALRAGRHQCQLSAEYRFRPCTVGAARLGRYSLSFPNGLMGIEGTLERRGATLVFTGRITEAEPFMCASVERQLPDYSPLAEQCRRQPLTAVLRRSRNGWVGTLTGLREVRARYANDRPRGQRQRPLGHQLAPYASGAIPLTILD